MARIQSTAETFKIAVQKTLEATHKVLVDTAKREHGRVMSTNPRPSTFQRVVDGRPNVAEEAVKPNGVIVYFYPRMDEVVTFAMNTLFDLSPVLSGEYRNGHRIFLNGFATDNLQGWKLGDEVSITNTVPYARKIEMGSMTMRVPGSDQVYTQALKKVRARFGNIAAVQFTFRAIVGGRQVNQGAAASSGQAWWLGDGNARGATGEFEKTLGPTQHNRANLRFPTLLITELK